MNRLNLHIHGNNPLCRLTTCDSFWISGRLLNRNFLCHSKSVRYKICIAIFLKWPNLPPLSTTRNTGLLLFLGIIIIKNWTIVMYNELISSAISHPLWSFHQKFHFHAMTLLHSYRNNELLCRVKHGTDSSNTTSLLAINICDLGLEHHNLYFFIQSK
jgi:hypothetical protein